MTPTAKQPRRGNPLDSETLTKWEGWLRRKAWGTMPYGYSPVSLREAFLLVLEDYRRLRLYEEAEKLTKDGA